MHRLEEEIGIFVSNCEDAKPITVIKYTVQIRHAPLNTGETEYKDGGIEYKSHTGEDLNFIDDNTVEDLDGLQYFRRA